MGLTTSCRASAPRLDASVSAVAPDTRLVLSVPRTTWIINCLNVGMRRHLGNGKHVCLLAALLAESPITQGQCLTRANDHSPAEVRKSESHNAIATVESAKRSEQLFEACHL